MIYGEGYNGVSGSGNEWLDEACGGICPENDTERMAKVVAEVQKEIMGKAFDPKKVMDNKQSETKKK